VVVIGHEKGHDTKSRIERNFGMARPEGYRKAVRLMDLADRFGLPVITLVDTPGAYPGKGAEERGQSEAIARSTEKCLQIGVPLISVIIGEGGSGGAVAFATADRRGDAGTFDLFGDLARGLRLDPLEGCREDARGGRGAAPDRAGPAQARRVRPVIKEPLGGAQRDRDATIEVGKAIRSMWARRSGPRSHSSAILDALIERFVRNRATYRLGTPSRARRANRQSRKFPFISKALDTVFAGQQIVAFVRYAQRLPHLPRFRHIALNRSRFFRGKIILVFA
jgi:hypothetical protein